ncbi:MAG: hypothetical protein ACXW0M_00895 [Methylosarcina sp.]
MFELLTDLLRYIWNHVVWLAKLRKAWIALFVLLLVLSGAFLLPGQPDDQLRYAGLVLQLLGVGTVAYLLRDKRVIFKRKSLLTFLTDWAKARPKFRPGVITLQASETVLDKISAQARISIWRDAGEGASVEQRLNVIEANLITLDDNHRDLAVRTDKVYAQLTDELAVERQQREKADRETTEKLEKFGADGLHIEATGIFWLIIGIVLATIPTELTRILDLIQ